MNAQAKVLERISYDAYGRARHHRATDLTGDGASTRDDWLFVQARLGLTGGAGGVADLNRDGVVNSQDLAIVTADAGPALPAGLISSPLVANPLGYAGYHFNPEFQVYLARHRYYDPVLGRWLTRDPAGYVDGMNLYLYGLGSPFVFVDPLGLFGGYGSDPGVSRAITAAGEEIGPRLKNGAIGAGSGAGGGAVVGAGVGAGVGAIGGAGIGAVPGALAGAGAGALGGFISGFISGLMAPPNASVISVATNGAIGGAVSGLTGGATAPLVGGATGTATGAMVGGGHVATVAVSTSTSVQAGAMAGATAGTIAVASLPTDGGAGQEHHAISRRVHEALEEHKNLKGHYQARDPRFTAKAVDADAHRGYQAWHRELDDVVSNWIRNNPNATPAQFEEYLRNTYNAPDIARRFISNPCGGR